MINYELAETAIESLLAPLVAEGVTVRGLPDDPQRQGVGPGAGPVVVHGWFGATPAGQGSLDGSALPLTNRIVLEVRTPRLKGPLGQYELPERIRALMQGARVPGLGRFEFAGWQLQGRGEGPNDRGYSGIMSFTVLSMT